MNNNLLTCFDCDFRADSEKLKELLTSKVTKDCNFCEALKELDLVKDRLDSEYELNKVLAIDVVELSILVERLDSKKKDLKLQVKLKQEKIEMLEQIGRELINDNIKR